MLLRIQIRVAYRSFFGNRSRFLIVKSAVDPRGAHPRCAVQNFASFRISLDVQATALLPIALSAHRLLHVQQELRPLQSSCSGVDVSVEKLH